ncbi:hypothetical protein LMG28727_07232 [Paraburkholderia kirstenboschensis]|nr:hypothetical protein LMG28727_07232 [Paraburkholderia kirstenboschensis]
MSPRSHFEGTDFHGAEDAEPSSQVALVEEWNNLLRPGALMLRAENAPFRERQWMRELGPPCTSTRSRCM